MLRREAPAVEGFDGLGEFMHVEKTDMLIFGSAEPPRSLSFAPPSSKRRPTADCLAALGSSA
jgi:hypothetical protein